MAMWAWFVVPLGVMSLGYAHALGISMFVSLFRAQQKVPDEQLLPLVLSSYGTSLFLLGLGWILHFLMGAS